MPLFAKPYYAIKAWKDICFEGPNAIKTGSNLDHHFNGFLRGKSLYSFPAVTAAILADNEPTIGSSTFPFPWEFPRSKRSSSLRCTIDQFTDKL